ncbi:MAG: hypothetical protein DRH08_00155 [Deltaproteobacteria bacterium]|nr:MAG: hypothetical protein DRH08_00155 [Deltaproteobacteria bacterium]
MTELDDILVPTAFDLIDEFGKLLTFTPPTGTYVPGAGSKVSESPDPFDRKGSPPFPYERSLATGRLIIEGNAITLVADQDLAIKPAIGWLVEVDGVTWRTVRVDAIYSGELVAAWEMELER